MREYGNDGHDFDLIEAERQHLAERLETGILEQIQLLAAQLRAFEMAASRSERRSFGVLSALVRDLLQQTLDLQSSLHPPALSTLGLMSALEALQNQLKRSTGVDITMSLTTLPERLAPRLETALYRSIEAILLSCIRGGARHIMLTSRIVDGDLRFGVQVTGGTLDGPDTVAAILPSGCELTTESNHYLVLRVNMDGQKVLTPREQSVLMLVAQGMTNRQVAAALDIRPRTVKFHLDNIYSKLHASSRTEAVTLALQQGLIEHPA